MDEFESVLHQLAREWSLNVIVFKDEPGSKIRKVSLIELRELITVDQRLQIYFDDPTPINLPSTVAL